MVSILVKVKIKIACFSLAVLQSISLAAQPQPGDTFREYPWTMPPQGEKFLRVGGRLDYQLTPEKFPGNLIDNEGRLLLAQQIDLKNAIKAELTIEKVLSHEDTKGLKFSLNGKPFIAVPEASHIPEPQSEYYHHFYPVCEVPLRYLNQKENRIELKVDTLQDWNWPQHLVYGMILRIYYDRTPDHLRGKVVVEDRAGENKALIRFEPKVPEKVREVHFIGEYKGINYEGDGIYDQWHYHYFRGELMHHIGTASKPDFSTNWSTEWLPDQDQPIKISAWIRDEDGLTYFLTSEVEYVLGRKYKVELCEPYDLPRRWVTRGGEHTEKFDIKGNLEQATEAKLIWTSWSPGYMNGLYVNDFLVYVRGGENYVYEVMEVPVVKEDMYVFKQGQNSITTGKTPLYDGQMVHGMEVMWPGIMVLIKYE